MTNPREGDTTGRLGWNPPQRNIRRRSTWEHTLTGVLQWSIVIAGISDFFRPVEKLSITQNLAITATGLIWTRWCLIIKPRNVLYVYQNHAP